MAIVVADEGGFLGVVSVHAEQQRQAAARGELHRGEGGGRQDDVGTRLGARSGHDVDIRETELRPVAAQAGSGQRGEQQVERLGEAVLVAVQTGAEDLEVDPRAAPADTESEATTRELIEQGGLLGECDRVLSGQHADRGTDRHPAGRAQQVSGQGDRRGADPVRHEMVLGDPHVVEACLLGGHRGGDRGFQHGGVVLTGELCREQDHPEAHSDDQQSRSSGLWLSSWPRAEMNAR